MAEFGKWISVKDELPTTKEDVLVVVDGRIVELGWYGQRSNIWYRAYTDDHVLPVTHWMPKPKTPKEDA